MRDKVTDTHDSDADPSDPSGENRSTGTNSGPDRTETTRSPDNPDTPITPRDSETTGPAADSDADTAPYREPSESAVHNPAKPKPTGVNTESDSATAQSDDSPTTDAANDSSGTTITESSDATSTEKDSGAEESVPIETTAPSTAPHTRRFPRPHLGRAGRITASCVAAVLFIAAASSSVYFYLQNQHNKATLTAQEQARDAACKYGPVLATYDSKHLDRYFGAVLAGATGSWRKQFDSTSKDLRDVLIKGEVATTVSDVQCAIVSNDSTSAQAIVVVGQSITSLGTQGKPEPGQLSISMRLEKDGTRWLVNKVDSPLTTPPGSQR